INSLHATVARAVLASEVAGPGLEPRAPALPVMRSASAPRRSTAVEAYADGMRGELRMRVASQLESSRRETDLCDRAAALAAEAETMLGAPADGTSQKLRTA